MLKGSLPVPSDKGEPTLSGADEEDYYIRIDSGRSRYGCLFDGGDAGGLAFGSIITGRYMVRLLGMVAVQ